MTVPIFNQDKLINTYECYSNRVNHFHHLALGELAAEHFLEVAEHATVIVDAQDLVEDEARHSGPSAIWSDDILAVRQVSDSRYQFERVVSDLQNGGDETERNTGRVFSTTGQHI